MSPGVKIQGRQNEAYLIFATVVKQVTLTSYPYPHTRLERASRIVPYITTWPNHSLAGDSSGAWRGVMVSGEGPTNQLPITITLSKYEISSATRDVFYAQNVPKSLAAGELTTLPPDPLIGQL